MSTPVVVSRIQNRRGTQSQFNALYPPGYNGVGGFGSIPGFNLTNYPNVLMPGELALCTDSRRMFIGNLNGEYIDLAFVGSGNLSLFPLSIILLPSLTPIVIPGLTYKKTPFFSLLYSITDSISEDWNVVGSTFSRNGELQITAIDDFIPPPPIPPFPPLSPVSLTDTGTEINTSISNNVNFSARYDLSLENIEILYSHNFPGSLVFNTSTIKWSSF